MSHKLMTFCLFVFILGSLASLTIEKSWFGTTDRTNLNTVVAFNEIEDSGSFTILKIPQMVGGFFTTFWQMARWDYSYLRGGYELMKWIILWPITFGAFFVVLQFLMSSLFSVLRR